MPSEIEQLRQTALAIRDTDEAQKCAEVLTQLEDMKQSIRRAEGDIKSRLLEWCLNGNRRIDLADGLYKYAGYESLTSCLDVPAALEALLEANGGDVRGLALILCSEPIKHGAAKGVLTAEVYERLFCTTKLDKLKEGGKKKLLTGNAKFEK